MEMPYELLGRKQEIIENQHAEYMKMLGVLREIKDGKISLDRLHVEADSWSVDPLAPPAD